MILTLIYMYATIRQWWRLGVLKNKLNGTLNSQNALLLCASDSISDPKHKRCFENLLLENDGRIVCTVVPRQKLNLKQWIVFPKNFKCFPIHIGPSRSKLESPKFHILLQAQLDSYTPHQSELIEIEKYGELVAWRASDFFEVILKTDLMQITRLMNSFNCNPMDINHDLRLIKVETVDVEGYPSKIKYDRTFSIGERCKYSYNHPSWKIFVENVRHLYSKLNDNPKIMIENGTKIIEEKKVPVSEVKPIKKSIEKTASKNTLEVHPHSTHKKDKSKSKTDAPRSSVKTDEKLKKVETKKVEEKIKKVDEKEKPKKVEEKSKKVEEKIKKEEEKTRKEEEKAKKEDAKLKKDEKKTEEKTKSVEEKPKKADVKLKKAEKTKSEEKVKKISKTDSKSKLETTPQIKVENGAKPKMSSKEKTDGNKLTVEKSYSEAAQCSSKNLQRQNATSSKETSPNKVVKPPNILVYADSVLAKDNVKSVLKSIINKEKYTIYDLPVNTSSSFWDSSTILVIVCGNVTPNLTSHLLQYLVSGGQLLCLCSDLLYSVLQTFSTAEVREHELVRFTYGEWKRVKMMHHIFCYQASPARKQFSKDSDQSINSNGSSPVAPRTPSTVDIQHNGLSYTIQVQVLGAEETWQTPSLLLATVRNSPGKAIFSQVHLEVDPTQYQDDESKYAALRDSDQARLEIMKHILSTHLDIDCRNMAKKFEYSSAYFLGRHDLKLQLLNNCSDIADNKLVSDDVQMVFCGKGIEPGLATATRLPVMILSCPTNFSTVSYFETLETENVGRLVIYSDILSSSQKLLAKKMIHGIAVITRQQSEGKGRSNNEWLSPDGCAMFSMQLHINMNSPFGTALPLVQHMVMVAIVSSIKSLDGLENLEIGLKWPNDLYAYSSIKIGGLVVNSSIIDDIAVVNIGCGVNLSNSEPTVCLNEMIARHNADHKVNVPPIEYEKFFASAFNEIERILNIVQGGDMNYLYDAYYKYWLHGNAKISVSTSDGNLRDVTVTGIDKFGFLLVQSEDGVTSSVQPDGNSFDMLKGLIAPKIS